MTMPKQTIVPVDLDTLRARLSAARGPHYWRSLDELATSPAFQDVLSREFPDHAAEWHDAVSRRRFLQLMGASLALAGLGACTRQPEERIVPYVRAPEDTLPGQPQFFASAMPFNGSATGVLVESHTGRPTKVEGNPEHPASLGATDVFAQASLLSLYDPDRSQAVLHAGQISTWNAFLTDLNTRLETHRQTRGARLRILSETVSSPSLGEQMRAFHEAFPMAQWHQYEPVTRDALRAGTRLAFGQALNPVYRFDRADVVLSVDADVLTATPGHLRYARDFAARRRLHGTPATMNRLYAVESTPTLTGAMADHRWPRRAHDIARFAYRLARAIGVPEVSGPEPEASPVVDDWFQALVDDLRQHRGRSLLVAGDQQPPTVQALIHAINHTLGNVGHTVVYTDPIEVEPVDHLASLDALVDAMEAGEVETLIILGGNPVYTAPADFRFAERLAKVTQGVHLSLYADETSALCHWHIPQAHYLEAWSDARAYDGTVSIVQPLIAPLYGGKSLHDVVAVLTGKPDQSGYDLVQDFWRRQHGAENFSRLWQEALHDGVVANTTLPIRQVGRQSFTVEATEIVAAEPSALDLIFRPDPTVWDGCFANNGWLQELPKPLTKLTWDNAALLSPGTAQRLGLRNEDVVDLSDGERTVRAPVWIVPGQTDNTVTVHLGYGRWRSGRVGTGAGFNAYTLRTSAAPWVAPGLQVRPTGTRYPLATTQQHHSMEGRHLVREATLRQALAHPHLVHDQAHEPSAELTLYAPHAYEGYAWGMAIDLNACIGCNGCTIACQAENNIPIVGKTEVQRGREMHWIRLDRYYAGDLHNPATLHQPVLCMHCENAPCEVVCPVAATVHSDEGLNDMVYNRCVGTRYCSNNCPYKVRRFNFLQYNDFDAPSLKLMRNPNVTVRTRGVMEKCTYCVQRINAARIRAKLADRRVHDGDIVTACQAACPTQAIVFGDINDPGSRVAQQKTDPRNYALLAELNTRPRTTYLAKLRNPNPQMLPEDVAPPPGGHQPETHG